MGNDFSDLSTVKFQEKLKPYALEIYQNLFPGCYLQDLREEGVNVHILDKEFGIDSLIVLKSQQWISIQEKYRDYKFLITPYLQVEPPYPDFTQEFKNGYGTNYEQPGEWFKLGAQLYFYGWANETNTEFERWVLLNIAQYKLLVEKAGGLDKIGKLMKNNRHGKASFYAIPIYKLIQAIYATNSNEFNKLLAAQIFG